MEENKGKWKGQKFGKPKKVENNDQIEQDPVEADDLTAEPKTLSSKKSSEKVVEKPASVEKSERTKGKTKPTAVDSSEIEADEKKDEQGRTKQKKTPGKVVKESVSLKKSVKTKDEKESTPDKSSKIKADLSKDEPEEVVKKKRPRKTNVDSATEKTEDASAETVEKEIQNSTLRLNKYLAKAGLCSRREADNLITSGDVEVNGKVITELGVKVKKTDTISYKGKVLTLEKLRYVLLNKPKDSITTMEDTHDRRTVIELVADACDERIYPVGRLDRMTTGLLLLTNDGSLAKKLTHPSHQIKKIYLAVLNKDLSPEDMSLLLEGVELEDGLTQFDTIQYDQKSNDKTTIIVSLHSGKNRIVRRMFANLNYRVERLDRISFAGLTKDNLTRGKWRFLSDKEIGFLKMLK
jgi:23S rRNA pseudouridine2605 synthase